MGAEGRYTRKGHQSGEKGGFTNCPLWDTGGREEGDGRIFSGAP